MSRRTLAPLYSSAPLSAATPAAISFLEKLWVYEADAFTFLSVRRANGGRWRDYAICGNRPDRLRELLERHPADDNDIYFCPNAFSEPSRVAHHALPTRYAWSDIDADDPTEFDPEPGILWESSPGRYQALWVWKRAAAGLTAEQYSRNLWKLYGGDSGGWSITKSLRLPGTINHKPQYARPYVRLIRFDSRPQRMPLKLAFAPLMDFRTSERGINPTAFDPVEVIKRYRRKVRLEVRHLLTAVRVLRGDRSKRVFQIVAELVAVGASDDEIASVLWVNPYFLDKWGRDVAALERQIHRIRALVEADQ